MWGYIVSAIGLIGSIITICMFLFDQKIKMYIKVLVLVLSILALGIGVVNIKYEIQYSNHDMDTEQEYKVYIDEKVGFQISYPMEWNVNSERNENRILYIDNSNDYEDESTEDIQVSIYEMEEITFGEITFERLAKEIEGYDLCVINDYNYYKNTMMNPQLYMVNYAFEKNNILYLIFFICQPGTSRNKAQEVFDYMMNSLYFYTD